MTHLVIWTTTLTPVITEIAHGWRPLQDEATIAYHSFQVLSAHSPLLGQYSTSSYVSGHFVYDPGPLQFWLLAIPVHLDTSHGVLWGAGILSALVLSLGVEALWSRFPWACGVVGLAVIDLAINVPAVFSRPAWNPYFALPFIISSIALAWVVGSGSLRWWPWLVLTASIAIQSEVFFALIGGALVVGAPLFGLRWRAEAAWRWLAIGLSLGAVCWLPAVLQEITGSPGNLSLLLAAHRGSTFGPSLGVRAVAMMGSPSPIWLRSDANQIEALIGPLFHSGLALGAGVLGLLTAIALVAWRSARVGIASLAVTLLLCALGILATFAVVPKAIGSTLTYLVVILWPIGIAYWGLLVRVVVELARIASRTLKRDQVIGEAIRRRGTSRSVVVGCAAVCLSAAILAGWGISMVAGAASTQVQKVQIQQAHEITAAIERSQKPGPVKIVLPQFRSTLGDYSVVEGAFWQLSASGWSVALPANFSKISGIRYTSSGGWPVIRVLFERTGVSATRVSGG